MLRPRLVAGIRKPRLNRPKFLPIDIKELQSLRMLSVLPLMRPGRIHDHRIRSILRAPVMGASLILQFDISPSISYPFDSLNLCANKFIDRDPSILLLTECSDLFLSWMVRRLYEPIHTLVKSLQYSVD